MRMVRYMYIWSVYILALPAYIAFAVAANVHAVLTCRIVDGFWLNPIELIKASIEGFKIGHRFNMYWCENGELDFSILDEL